MSKYIVNNEDILIKSVLKGPSIEALHSEKKIASAIAIITKTYATTQYQIRVSTFSKKYKDYLKEHKAKDDSCGYIVNGNPLINMDLNERMKQLYNLPQETIVGFSFLENPWYNGGESKKYTVIITTKQ